MPIVILKDIGRNFLGAVSDIGEEMFPLDASHRMEPVFSAPGYRFVRTLKRTGDHTRPIVEEFTNPDGVRVVIKTLKHRFPTSCALHLLQESRILEAFSRQYYFPDRVMSNVTLPRLLEIRKSRYTFSLVMEFVSGVPISSQTKEKQQDALERVVANLRSFTRTIDTSELGVMTGPQLAITFPYYLAKAMLRRPAEWRIWVGAAVAFYRYIFSCTPIRYVLTHYDLSPENILLEGDRVTFFDFGRVNLALEETEVALIGRRYWKQFDPQSFADWLIRLVPSKLNQRRLVALTAYYWVQIFTFSAVGDENEAAIIEYLKFFSEKVTPTLL